MSESLMLSDLESKPRRASSRTRRIVAGTLALGLVFGLAGCDQGKDTDGGKNTTTAAAEPSALNQMSEANVASLNKKYDDVQKYWASKGVKADSELVILSGDKTFDCGTAGILTAYTLQSITCRHNTSKKAIVVTALNYNGVAAAAHSTQTATNYIISHEYGHVVADTVDNGNPPGDLGGELQADCFNGAGIAHTDRSGASAVRDYIRQSYADANHNASKAVQAYDIGFNARDPIAACAVKNMVALAQVG